MDLHSYLRALRRNWWIVVLATLLGTGIALVIAQQTPAKYESSVTFFVSTPTDAAGTAVQADQYAQRRVNSYVQLLTSDNLAQMILSNTDLDMTVSQITQEIKASAEPETVILTATVTDESAERSFKIVQAIGQQFGKMVDQLDNRGSPDTPTVQLNVTSGPTLDPTPVAPKMTMILGLGFVGGLAIGLALAILRDTLDKTVRSTESLRSLTDAPVLGTIGFDKGARKSPLILDSHARSARAEAVRQLRTNLQFVDAARPAGVIVVTSSVAGEGKTTTATNLAVSFADGGQRVVLVDADLRRPRVAGYLGLEGAVGLTNVLVGQTNLGDVLQPWGRAGLTVLPSGTIPPNPSELLGSRWMVELIAELRRRFDLVVIDTPPLLPVTDAAVASRLADGAVVMVRYGKTTRQQLATTLRSLQVVDARLLGTVLTMAPARDTAGYSGYRYGYGYGDADADQAGAPSSPDGPAFKQTSALGPPSVDADPARHRVGLRRPKPTAGSVEPTAPAREPEKQPRDLAEASLPRVVAEASVQAGPASMSPKR